MWKLCFYFRRTNHQDQISQYGTQTMQNKIQTLSLKLKLLEN